MGRPTLALSVLGAIGYAVVAQRLLLRPAAGAWGPLLLVGPFVAGALVSMWRGRRRVGVALFSAVLLGLAGAGARGFTLPLIAIALAQHAGLHALLGVAFGATLRQPVSLIGRLASRVHGGLTPAMAAYTRGVTLAWTLYFLGMAALSIVVWRTQPWATWTWLASAGTPLCIGALLVGEYGLRYRLHPEFERVPLRTSITAWRAAGLRGPTR